MRKAPTNTKKMEEKQKYKIEKSEKKGEKSEKRQKNYIIIGG